MTHERLDRILSSPTDIEYCSFDTQTKLVKQGAIMWEVDPMVAPGVRGACQCPGPLFEGERVCCRQSAPTRPPECRPGTDRGTVHPNSPAIVPPTCTIMAPSTAPCIQIHCSPYGPPAPSRNQPYNPTPAHRAAHLAPRGTAARLQGC